MYITLLLKIKNLLLLSIILLFCLLSIYIFFIEFFQFRKERDSTYNLIIEN
jgi:hypothetical protein